MLQSSDERQRNGAGENPNRVSQEASYQEYGGCEPAGAHAETRFQPGVGSLLLSPEIPRQEPDGYSDASDQISEGELQKGQIATGANARYRDDGQCRCFGCDDREQNCPGGEIAGAEEVVGSALLTACDPEAEPQGEDEVDDDNSEV